MGKSDPSEKLWSGACPSRPLGVCSPGRDKDTDLRKGLISGGVRPWMPHKWSIGVDLISFIQSRIHM